MYLKVHTCSVRHDALCNWSLWSWSQTQKQELSLYFITCPPWRCFLHLKLRRRRRWWLRPGRWRRCWADEPVDPASWPRQYPPPGDCFWTGDTQRHRVLPRGVRHRDVTWQWTTKPRWWTHGISLTNWHERGMVILTKIKMAHKGGTVCLMNMFHWGDGGVKEPSFHWRLVYYYYSGKVEKMLYIEEMFSLYWQEIKKIMTICVIE